jgi:hypothetical protein
MASLLTLALALTSTLNINRVYADDNSDTSSNTSDTTANSDNTIIDNTNINDTDMSVKVKADLDSTYSVKIPKKHHYEW